MCLRFCLPHVIFCWWSLSLTVLVQFPKFFIFVFPWFRLSLLSPFLVSCFQLLPSFHFTVCIFIDFINGFISIFFSDLEYIHNNYFEVIVCNSPILHFSWATAVGLLGFSEDTLSWMVLFSYGHLVWGWLLILGADVRSCLCWESTLFNFLFWLLGECGAMGCHG